MSIEDTGGPAFPNSNNTLAWCQGMTLRDYFAAHCEQEEIEIRLPSTVGDMAARLKREGIIGPWTDIIRAYGPADVQKLRSILRYEYADSMIAERSK